MTSSSAAGTTTCHALPCNIDYTGKAPVDVYFRPAPVNDEYQAATLRGRGLLAPTSKEDDSQWQGHVLTKDHATNKLKTVTTFEHLAEWHHEHLLSAMNQKESRLQTANDWMEVAKALHAPLPVASAEAK